jgi:hypothetical protein
MSKNKVEVLLTARDEISGTLKGIVAGFATTLAGLAVAAISIGHLKAGIEDAAKAQTSMIVSAGDVGTLMGVSYAKGLSAVKDIQKEISKMAAALPGETAGYAAIANSLTATMALNSKGNISRMKTDLMDLTKTFGLLAATKGLDMGSAGVSANRLISSSSSLTELKQLDLFEKNPLYMLYLQDELKKIGKSEEDWGKLGQDVKIKVASLAGKRAFTGEMLSNLEGTTESLLQGIQSGLFDPQTGIFGFLRELKGLNNRTGLDSVRDAIQAVSALSDSAGRLLAKYGLSFDPMEILARGFDFATEAMNAVSAALSGNGFAALKNLFRGLDFSQVKKINFKQVFSTLSEVGSNILSSIRNFDVSSIAKGFNSLVDLFADGLKNFDAGKTGQFIADTLSTILSKSLDLSSKINWGKLYAVVTDAIAAMFNSIGEAVAKLGSLGWDKWKSDVDKANRSDGRAIQDFGGKVMNKANEGARGIENGINGFFGLGSPRSSLPLPAINGSTNNSVASTKTFAPVINVTGVAQNLQETADYVLSAMNSRYMEYQAGVIA